MVESDSARLHEKRLQTTIIPYVCYCGNGYVMSGLFSQDIARAAGN